MSDSVFVGSLYESLKESEKQGAYTRVTLLTGEKDDNDQDIYYTAGNDTGATLEINNPYATQAMANNILASISGYRYKPFASENVLLDPAAELGDAITIGSVYSGIFRRNHDFSSLFLTDVSAERNSEEDEEYKFTPKENRAYNRTISQIKSSLRIQQDLIEARVTFEDAETLISQKIDTIEISASNGSDSSTITISADGVAIDSAVVEFSGMVTFYDLSHAGSTTINGSNITTGTISAERIDTISALARRITLGVYGDGENSGILFPSPSQGGFGSSITQDSYSLLIASGDSITLNPSNYLYLSSAYGIVLDSNLTQNSMWGTASPSTVFSYPETGQIYFQIES